MSHSETAHRPLNGWGRAGDLALAVIFWALITLEVWVLTDHGHGVGAKIMATIVAPVIAVPLAFRSIDPFRAFLVNSLGTLTMIAVGSAGDFYQWPNLLLLFVVGVTQRGARSVIALAVGLTGVASYFLTFRFEGLATGVMVLGLWLVAWLVGRVYGFQMNEHRLRDERDLAAELAATRQVRLDLESQRTTMARELHDVIGHTVNVMVVHAGAGRRAIRNDPDAAEQALKTIETTGRSALEELDRVLGVLRSEGDAPLAPLPTVESLPALVDEFSRAGLPTVLELTGTDSTISTAPAGVGLTVYRVVQEALTNAMKHAEATGAAVTVHVGEAEAHVTVRDDGRGRDAAKTNEAAERANGATSDAGAAGRGLIGITERVQLQGGRADFGPNPTRSGHPDRPGFQVTCRIPFQTGPSPSSQTPAASEPSR